MGVQNWNDSWLCWTMLFLGVKEQQNTRLKHEISDSKTLLTNVKQARMISSDEEHDSAADRVHWSSVTSFDPTKTNRRAGSQLPAGYPTDSGRH